MKKKMIKDHKDPLLKEEVDEEKENVKLEALAFSIFLMMNEDDIDLLASKAEIDDLLKVIKPLYMESEHADLEQCFEESFHANQREGFLEFN